MGKLRHHLLFPLNLLKLLLERSGANHQTTDVVLQSTSPQNNFQRPCPACKRLCTSKSFSEEMKWCVNPSISILLQFDTVRPVDVRSERSECPSQSCHSNLGHHLLWPCHHPTSSDRQRVVKHYPSLHMQSHPLRSIGPDLNPLNNIHCIE